MGFALTSAGILQICLTSLYLTNDPWCRAM